MSRSLAPKEHGAWGQLFLPLATALASGRPAPSPWLFAAGAALGFLAHEPALVLAGLRGPRALEEDGARARARLLLLGAVALLCGAAAFALAPPAARIGAALPLLLGGALVPLVRRGLEKTLPGELLAASALASAGLPVALAGGAPPPAAFGALAAWVLGFAASTAAVRGVIARQKLRSEPALPALIAATILLALAPLLLQAGAGKVALCALPLAALAWAVQLAAPHPRHLRQLGWALIAASVATAGLLVALAWRLPRG